MPCFPMASNNSSQHNGHCLYTDFAVEDLDYAMEGLSLSTMSQENSPAAISVDSLEDTLTHSTLEEASSEHGNQYVMNNYNNEAIVQGAPLTSSHDYYGFSINDVWESVSQRLEGIRGHVATLARDQWGCRFLQTIIETGTPLGIEMILDEVKDHTHELMTHHFGNYLIEKLFTSRMLSSHQIQRILFYVITDTEQLKRTCMNDHGTRVAQKMLTSLREPWQIAITVAKLRSITVPLLKNANGGYVIQQCVKVFTPACQKVIFDEIARNCVDVATDKNGCSVIQKCMAHGEGLSIRLLVESVILNSAILSSDPFGNYVVQYLIKRKIEEPPVTEMIIQQLRGGYVELSMNRHASHVIEVLFRHSDPADIGVIIMELVNSPHFVNVLQDPYGNYVAQRGLQFSTGVAHVRFVNTVLSNYAYLHAHPYGKRVLTFIKGIKRSVQRMDL